MELNWLYKKFDELSVTELYAILRLRNEVFGVEQNCVYLDADNKDQDSWHLAGWDGENLVAYARILPPGIAYEEASIGRVVTSPQYRRTGAGRELMVLAIDKTLHELKCNTIKISAQVYLRNFYHSLGFVQCGDEYIEDGLPHMGMILKK